MLPVCWRHLLDFPRQGREQSRKEHDIGDAFGEDDEYPSLEDITVDGVPLIRGLITDLALDILLYQSQYREHISAIVLRECNRIFKLFVERNPYFDGKISLIGHSLGSAILFDVRQLSLKPNAVLTNTRSCVGKRRTQSRMGLLSIKPTIVKDRLGTRALMKIQRILASTLTSKTFIALVALSDYFKC